VKSLELKPPASIFEAPGFLVYLIARLIDDRRPGDHVVISPPPVRRSHCRPVCADPGVPEGSWRAIREARADRLAGS